MDTSAPDESDAPAFAADITNGVARVNVPDALRLDGIKGVNGDIDTAHSNCGHMLYCNQGGYARYCYYPAAQTGCGNQDVFDDYNADCQYVCGHTACLYSTVRPC